MEKLLEFRQLIEGHIGASTAEVMATPIATLSFIRRWAPTEPIAHIFQPLLAVVAQGEKQVVLGGRTFNYGAGQYLTVSVDLPITSHIVSASKSEPFLAIVLTLQPTTIASLLLETGGFDNSLLPTPGIAVSNAPVNLLEPIMRLISLLDEPRDIPVLFPGIEREILWRLINGEQGSLIRQIGLADSRLTHISHAIRWIRDHYNQQLRIEELAARAHMSLSTFHRHFRVVTSMTPIQFQKQVRLQEARTRLIASAEDVASVGLAVGYDSPSQFSREYRRLFGAPPGKDTTYLRNISSGEERALYVCAEP
jgi:AraC-like DNA-binding protein